MTYHATPDAQDAIIRANSETARVLAERRCTCCHEAVPVLLVATDLRPRGQWLDDEGLPHEARR